MTNNLKYCLMLLEDNDERVKKEARRILLKLCDNIIKHPQESKYRKILLSNEIVSTKLLPATGAIECLFEAGFVESDNGFVLPKNASIDGIKELCDLLSDSPNLAKSEPVLQASTSIQKSQQIKQKPYKKSFLEELIGKFKDVLRYEDQNLQNKVKMILPIEKLQITAMEKLREVQKEIKTKNLENDVVIEDLLLAELLSWFKLKFFKWVDSPDCKSCNGSCSYDRSEASYNSQISRIEIHKCKVCGAENQFPRYTDPEILLHTRKGRCGEWANCFTLICRTVGFDARLVYDETDHVWTEVWSIAHNRWIHADSCENAMDSPLIYEKGWGKKLSYIVAFSKDEIQDVTWRYTRNNEEVIKRRKHCSEETLLATINKLNSERQNSPGYSQLRKKYVLKRCALELAEMLTAPPGSKKACEEIENKSDYGGRTSGSLAWRLTRGETNNIKYEPMQWILPKETFGYELIYSVINDLYTVKDCTNNVVLETKQKWQNGIEFLDGGVFRKEEEDWKMVYLSRSPGSPCGKITWSFTVQDSVNVCVDSVQLKAKTQTYNGALVNWEIKGVFDSNKETKEQSKVISISDSECFKTKDLKGAIKIKVCAILSGGEGDTAWQHAQLFRESLNANAEEHSMVIKIELINKFLT